MSLKTADRKLIMFTLVTSSLLMFSAVGWAQSDQYKRTKPAESGLPSSPSVDSKSSSQGTTSGTTSGTTNGATAGASANSPAQSDKESDKVDVSDLEKKYWAPKDTDFSVVQNRTYAKQGKTAVSLLYGVHLNDSFSDGSAYGLAVNYFMSERYGLELQYYKSNLEDNDLVSRLLKDHGALPDHNKVDQYYGVSFNWIPIYAKASFLGKRIIYFDLAISPGIGLTSYNQIYKVGTNNSGSDDKTALTASLDITQFFFISKYFALRFDLKNRWFRGDIIEANTRQKISTETEATTIFLVGGTFYF